VKLWWGAYFGAIGIATPSSAGAFLLYLSALLLAYMAACGRAGSRSGTPN
jgi:hypothetical protein